jgi:hypothetical protein
VRDAAVHVTGAAGWSLLARRSLRVLALLARPSRPAICWKLPKSSPAQNARPLPERTTARTPGSFLSDSPASTIAANCAPSSAFIFSGRFMRTSATPPSIEIVTRSSVMWAS